jgi:HD-GYP domain-containing protein (c-di-GMP phosphodiesterase class II)
MGTAAAPDTSPRLADILGALSLVTDLAAGVPMETSLRTCLVATRIGRAIGLDEGDLADAYYTALLRHLGCTAFAHEAARLAAGDDHDLIHTFEVVDRFGGLSTAAHVVRELASNAVAGARIAAIGRTLGSPRAASSLASAHCSQATALASDLEMRPAVVRALGQIYERFDGQGLSGGLRGEAIELVARLLHVANVVEIQHRHAGRARAEAEIRRRRGAQLDPDLAGVFLADPAPFWAILEAPSIWEAYLDAEPGAARRVGPERREALARAFAQFADLKIPSKLGHSPAVASLAERAGRVAGLAPGDLDDLRVAALLHDIGVVSVPNGIWEKQGPLNMVEWERVRLHAYHTQRVLARVPSLGPIAEIASLHHERCDGSGYPRGTAPAASARAARILACADTFEALTTARAHRPAITPAAAAGMLQDEARQGRLCAAAVECVLAAVGQAKTPVKQAKMALTEREAEVLVALARGLTNKEIAVALGISPKTVQHHLAHVYAKVGISTRAAAALYAVRSNLLS